MIIRDITFLTSEEVVDALQNNNGIIIPVASIEQCGRHGTTGIDYHIASYLAPIIADNCNMCYAPVIAYGDTLEMEDFKGTVNIPTKTLSDLYYHVALSFFKSSAQNIVFLVTHSLNSRSVDCACRKLYAEGINCAFVDFWKACSQVSCDILTDKEYGTGHGAEQITSVSLAINSKLIDLSKALNEQPIEDIKLKVKHLYGGSNVCTSYSNFHSYCKSGSWGNIQNASEEKGKIILDRAINLISKNILEVLK